MKNMSQEKENQSARDKEVDGARGLLAAKIVYERRKKLTRRRVTWRARSKSSTEIKVKNNHGIGDALRALVGCETGFGAQQIRTRRLNTQTHADKEV